MDTSLRRMASALIVGGLLVASAALVTAPVCSDDRPTSPTPSVESFDAGMRIGLQPNGLRAEPSDSTGVTAPQFSSSSEGLVEERSPVDGGGILMRLDDRFQHAMRAEVGTDGAFEVGCSAIDSETPERGDAL